MAEPTLDEMIRTWDSETNGVPPEESTLAARLQILIYRALAEGEPVSAERVARDAGVPAELVNAVFEEGKTRGGEWDDAGRLVGEGLTLAPTRHRFSVSGRALYAWCALDAMHLPGLLGETAQVESSDPISGEAIRLTIPPEGAPTFDPPETVLTIVLSQGNRTGPDSPLCEAMQFFATGETAAQWARGHPDVTVMTVDAAARLVSEHIHAPLAGVLAQLDRADDDGNKVMLEGTL